MEEPGKWYESRKLWVVLGAALIVVGLTLGGTAIGVSPEERQAALDTIKWLVGFFVTTHAATDITAKVVGGKKMVE